jgi:hypothetical protein
VLPLRGQRSLRGIVLLQPLATLLNALNSSPSSLPEVPTGFHLRFNKVFCWNQAA